jgi:branched-chain amino acid transport system ATP-binding protein
MTPILETRGLTKRFGGLTAVDAVDFTLPPGDLRAVIGPNGAGKTTFFNVVSGFLPPTSGDVYFRGERITGLPPHRISRLGIARTLQVKSVFSSLTLEENVWLGVQSRERVQHPFRPALGVRHLRERVDELLELLGLTRLARVVAGNLAYGDLCLLEIAMALGTRPALLLLDEPTAGMSPEETVRTAATIRTLGTSVAVVLVEHDMELVLGIADSISVFHQGRLLAQGTPGEITRNVAVQEAYLGVEHAPA